MPLSETAYAKINLALHVRRRRVDGYHELETLFAFVDDGDRLEVGLARANTLAVHGEFAGALGPAAVHRSPLNPPPPGEVADPKGLTEGELPPPRPLHHPAQDFAAVARASAQSHNNIVLTALAALPHAAPWSIHLDKRLPVAAGLGGGSADAGAVFRLVEQAAGLPDDWHHIAARLGADVPACVASRTVIGRGTGTELIPGPDDLAGCPVLLVNPRRALSTGPVFKAWDGQDRGPLPTGTAREIAQTGRNDLEAPAITLCPAIADVLAALRETAAWLTRMSGSGATCFALYDTVDQRDAAAAHVAARHPGWWQMAGALR